MNRWIRIVVCLLVCTTVFCAEDEKLDKEDTVKETKEEAAQTLPEPDRQFANQQVPYRPSPRNFNQQGPPDPYYNYNPYAQNFQNRGPGGPQPGFGGLGDLNLGGISELLSHYIERLQEAQQTQNQNQNQSGQRRGNNNLPQQGYSGPDEPFPENQRPGNQNVQRRRNNSQIPPRINGVRPRTRPQQQPQPNNYYESNPYDNQNLNAQYPTQNIPFSGYSVDPQYAANLPDQRADPRLNYGVLDQNDPRFAHDLGYNQYGDLYGPQVDYGQQQGPYLPRQYDQRPRVLGPTRQGYDTPQVYGPGTVQPGNQHFQGQDGQGYDQRAPLQIRPGYNAQINPYLNSRRHQLDRQRLQMNLEASKTPVAESYQAEPEVQTQQAQTSGHQDGESSTKIEMVKA